MARGSDPTKSMNSASLTGVAGVARRVWLVPAIVLDEVCKKERRERDALIQKEEQQHAADNHAALRKAVEFLKPDTKSDLRFGKAKPSPTQQPTSTPTAP